MTTKRPNLTKDLKAMLLEDIRRDDGTVWPPEVAAAYLGISTWMLKKMRRSRRTAVSPSVAERGPDWVDYSGTKKGYRKCDLDAWVEACRDQLVPVDNLSTGEPAGGSGSDGSAP